ncbi:MAG: nucleotidyltransferase domain-containing protein [Calditrichaeota bacterium]|nr:nucleotidyltransferase domain-containing protein [Calditrichota bacterium]
MLSNSIKNKIIALLQPHKPQKIILFGSHARGDANADSDIDLMVVLDTNKYPKNFHEKMEMYLPVSSSLSPLKENIPIDLIVYTRPMYDKFLKLNSMFSREILKSGVTLYEINHSRMD